MKLRYAILILGAVLISSCTKWLDIQPKDSITEDKLFELGDGYRIALNGIYKVASSNSLYGQELTWGVASFMGADYDLGYGYGPISIHSPYFSLAYDFDYTDYKVVPTLDAIWTNGYSCIANCNNLLGNIRDESPGKFRRGEYEKDLIMGEALAVRALMHFDLMRLYAPAKDDGEVYMPYYDQDGLSTGAPHLKVDEVIERVVRDLKEAQNLVVGIDTVVVERKDMISNTLRFENSYTLNMPLELREAFFSARGYRMNYFAATAILARVYSYMGLHKEAYDEAIKVIDYRLNGDQGSIPFMFTLTGQAGNNTKLYDDLIFCFGNEKLYDTYKPYSVGMTNTEESYLTLQRNLFNSFDDPADYRKTKLIKDEAATYTSLKYVEPSIPSAASRICADMLPVVRLSEMYYIKAEYEASLGRYSDAAASLDMVRMGRGCTAGRLSFADQASFQEELLREVRREFIAEGQTYFYYKKFGVIPVDASWSMQPEHFVFPKPVVEDIQF